MVTRTDGKYGPRSSEHKRISSRAKYAELSHTRNRHDYGKSVPENV